MTVLNPAGAGSQYFPLPLNLKSRSTLVVDHTFHNTNNIWLCDAVYNPQDTNFYLLYNDTNHYGIMQAPAAGGPWTDLGTLPGAPTASGIPQARLLLSPVTNKWSLFMIDNITFVPDLYQTAAAGLINSTYSLTTAGLLTLGTTSAFDQGRCSEVFIFQDQSATWRMLYMGGNSPFTLEQLGMATATAPEGPWTKVQTTPIVPASGSTSAYDNTIVADPNVIYWNGVYYILSSYGGQNQVTGTGVFGMAVITTTDWVNFTKRGIGIPPAVAAAGVPDALAAWGGGFVWQGKDTTCALPQSATLTAIDYYYFAKAVPGATHLVTGCHASIDPTSFTNGVALMNQGWTRVEAEGAASQLTKSGTWSTVTSGALFNQGFSGTGLIESNTVGSQQTLTWTGRRARVAGVADVNFGIANVFLDGNLVGTFDGNYGANVNNVGCQVYMYDTQYLTPATHTLQVVVSGLQDSTGTGSFVGLDFWEYF